MFDYASLAATVVAQIADKGRDVTYKYKTQGTYIAATDSFTGQTTATTTEKMLITNYKKRDIDGTLIKASDRLGLLADSATLTRAPKTADQIVDGGETLTVISVEDVEPGDTALLYKLQLRK